MASSWEHLKPWVLFPVGHSCGCMCSRGVWLGSAPACVANWDPGEPQDLMWVFLSWLLVASWPPGKGPTGCSGQAGPPRGVLPAWGTLLSLLGENWGLESGSLGLCRLQHWDLGEAGPQM